MWIVHPRGYDAEDRETPSSIYWSDRRPLGHWPETAFWEITPVVVPQANLTPRRSILGGVNQMLALADHLGNRRYFNAYAKYRSPISLAISGRLNQVATGQ
jgi:hypothetical protein